VGIIPPTPSWGGMVAYAIGNQYYETDPMLMIIPGLAIFLTVIAFNLFGDGLRDALDPRSSR
jgi:peptide/nickel transport system permease protein/oligopeptide transport system permease protein